MIEKFKHVINGINIYIDEYLVDDMVLKGRKQNTVINDFLIMNRKTAENMYNTFIISERKRKIEKLKKLK